MKDKLILKEENSVYAMVEALNSLKTNLSFCGDDIKVVEITSCGENEGKTTVSFQLAKSMAGDGKKVLLVDCDMRKSVISVNFNLKRGQKINGLSHYLSGQAKIDEIVYETSEEGFDIVVAGPMPPNTPALLGSEKFSALIAENRDKYDLIIVDCPPVGMVIDAAVVAPNCDGILLLMQTGQVSKHEAMDVKRQLEVTGCPLLGVVLNKVTSEDSKYYKGYYKGYYSKYYGNEKQ